MKTNLKNHTLAIAVLLAFSGCGGQSQKQAAESDTARTETTAQTILQTDSFLSTRTIDGMKVSWIRDNAQERLMPRTLFPDATDRQIDSLSLQNGIPASVSTFLIESNGKQLLFDTGVGAPDSRLLSGLKRLNIQPADIDYLFITHFHGDHIGGMMQNGKAVFPNAEVYASQTEYDAWMNMPADKKQQVEQTMAAYKERLHLFAFGDSLPEHVQPMEAI